MKSGDLKEGKTIFALYHSKAIHLAGRNGLYLAMFDRDDTKIGMVSVDTCYGGKNKLSLAMMKLLKFKILNYY